MTIDTLLIPTDGSNPAESAARRGFVLAAQCDASVRVLSVADSSVATGAGYAGDSPSIRNRLRERATNRATSLRDEATERGLEATAATREGIPAKEIVAYANEHDIDTIAIGTSGRGGVARAVIGSVADKVVRTAPVPVLTITPDAAAGDGEPTVDSILLPTDGSDTAMTAARRGLEFATDLQATVHLLSVTDHGRDGVLSTLSGDDREGSDDRREAVADAVEALTAEARSHGLETVAEVRDGDPATEIVDYAESATVDLIAMGTAGRGGFERYLLGSVTDKVVRTASIPVMTTRANEPGADGE
ncbi:universal stress protein [Natronolimnohabitans innermongolicus]|uniref:Stress response protein n=1 Tax=Natronolimnohabitans innermongolicus JCM 12255 TaxID=1227499 RepID=L9WUV4_9EURY|nr:universal stress protein [Natronolimnohabitans innermongolicus]ELY53197.1 stress response protein [Natronolimnohabitans innermongolicus JCM 12255]